MIYFAKVKKQLTQECHARDEMDLAAAIKCNAKWPVTLVLMTFIS
jgi:hypothetical protein